MVVGVVAFSFATGSLSSIMSNFDEETVLFKKNLEQLDLIKQNYSIGQGLYEEIR